MNKKGKTPLELALGIYGGLMLCVVGFSLMFGGPILALICAVIGAILGLPIIGIIVALTKNNKQ